MLKLVEKPLIGDLMKKLLGDLTWMKEDLRF